MRTKKDEFYTITRIDIYVVTALAIISFLLVISLQSPQITVSLKQVIALISGIFTAFFVQFLRQILDKIPTKKNLNSSTYQRDNYDFDYDFHSNPRSLIEAHEVQSDGVLPTSSTVIGAVSLEVFARKCKPTGIIGVNRGGWLLSTYLAHRLNIDRENLFRFDAEPGILTDNEDILNSFGNNYNQPNILLVDDISRTGKSIEKALIYVRERFPSCIPSVAVLVVCGRKTDKNVEYNPYWTQHLDIQLPWSSDERKKEARKNINSQEKVVILGNENSLEQKLPVLRIADSETKDGEEFDISNDDIEAIIRFLNISESSRGIA